MTSSHAHSLSRRALLGAGTALGVGALLPPPAACAETVRPTAPGAPVGAAVKSRPTYLNAERVAAARENIARFGWAREIRDARLAPADAFTALDPDLVWLSVTTQGLPRSYAVNQTLGSPITGTDIFQFGNYPWLGDPLNRPYELTDPSSGYVFPTNDFAAFYASALDESGNFHRELGDPAHLVNVRYPERGPTWGVDDGYGWIDDNGDRWTFIAYYNHWFTWYGPTAMMTNWVGAAADAYTWTGEVGYARNALIALDRIADVYPAMDRSAHPLSEGFLASDGGTGQGKVVGCIWETGMARALVLAYEALYPAIADADDAGVATFLQAKAEQYGLSAKDSTEAIRANIEHGILRQVYPAVRQARIRGNFGMHQSVLAAAAVVQDDPAASREWLEFVFQPGEFLSAPYRITGGDVYGRLLSGVDRDGVGDEAGPSYNNLWINQMTGIADLIEGYDLFPGADLYSHPSMARLVLAQDRLVMLNRYVPPIGDSGQTGAPGLFGTAATHLKAFQQYRDPASAQLAWQLAGGDVTTLNAGIYTVDAEQLQADVQAVVEEQGELALPSVHHAGYGAAQLRTGTGSAMRALQVYYGRTTGHGHGDALNLGLWAHGVDLLPDLGYPEFADQNNRRYEWTDNAVAHNTVVVDAGPQRQDYAPGRPIGFCDDGPVHYIDVDAARAYPQTSRYRRSAVMIDVDGENSYVVDVVRVVGGGRHDFSFHAAEGEVTTTGLQLTAQQGGSYAGADVEQPTDGQPARPGASGFDWLTNVARDTDPVDRFSLDLAVVDTYGVLDPLPDLHLRTTVLADFDEVALADGQPPRNKPGNPSRLRYLLGKREGSDLSTTVISVLEPYIADRVITAVSRVTPQTSAPVSQDEVSVIRIELADGRTDYVIHSLRPEVRLTIERRFTFAGVFAVYRMRDGKGEWVRTVEAGHFDPRAGAPARAARLDRPGVITGAIADYTSDLDRPLPNTEAHSEVIITLGDGSDAAELVEEVVGLEVHVANDGARTAVYPIVAAEVVDAGLRLDLGRITLVRGYADPADDTSGYAYDVALGQSVRIPRTWGWDR